MTGANTDVKATTKLAGINKRKRRGFFNQRTLFIVTILAVPVLNWLIFWLFVNVQTIALAFRDARTDALTLKNFVTFWNDLTTPVGNSVGVALKNTLIYFATDMLIKLPLSLAIAYFIYKRIKGYKFFRIVFYLPAIISGVVMVTAYTKIIDPNGPLDSIIKLFGGKIPPYGLLGHKDTATAAIVGYYIWTGFTTNVLLFSGAMSRLPLEILESAKLEGCGPWKEITKIVFPLIWPTVTTVIIFTLTGIFNAGGPILLFGADQYETTTISYWIFKQLYGDGIQGGTGNYNVVSCTGLCFTMVGVPIIMTIRWLLERRESAEY